MRLLVLAVCAGALMVPAAAARSLQIQGVTGYLSEYELTANVSGQLADGGTEDLSTDCQTCGSMHARRAERNARSAQGSLRGPIT